MKTKMIYILLLFDIVISNALFAQNHKKVIGTIGKEKISNEKIVICEFGTQACMPVMVDPEMQVIVQGDTLRPGELKTGWYVEAEVSKSTNGQYFLKHINIDPKKTIICFASMTETEAKDLKKLLLQTNGIKKVEAFLEIKQALITYDPKIIKYNEIEKKIIQSNFKIE